MSNNKERIQRLMNIQGYAKGWERLFLMFNLSICEKNSVLIIIVTKCTFGVYQKYARLIKYRKSIPPGVFYCSKFIISSLIKWLIISKFLEKMANREN